MVIGEANLTVVYISMEDDCEQIILLLYVDDMLIANNSLTSIRDLKERLKKEFEMKDLRRASRILGNDILRNRTT